MSTSARFNEFLAAGGEAAALALADVLLVFAFRALPIAVHAILRRDRSALQRCGVAGAYMLLLVAAGEHVRAVVAWSAAGLTYFGAVACVAHWLSVSQPLRARDTALMFCVLVGLCVGVPATLLRPVAFGTFQILGWELMLKTYSYVKEQGARRGDLRACLFFCLVDPTVVYVQRAKTLPAGRSSAMCMARVALGLSSLFVSFFALAPLASVLSEIETSRSAKALALVLLSGFAHLLAAYGRHSGLASLQIGLLRLSGYAVAERYDYPLLARNPLEFWTRWNTYVGQWTKRYLYAPLALLLARRLRARSKYGRAPAWTSGFALLLAFCGIGWLHDLYTLCEDHRLTLVMTGFFAVNAAVLVGWTAAARSFASWRVRAAAVERHVAHAPWPSPHFVNLERAAFCVVFLALVGASF